MTRKPRLNVKRRSSRAIWSQWLIRCCRRASWPQSQRIRIQKIQQVQTIFYRVWSPMIRRSRTSSKIWSSRIEKRHMKRMWSERTRNRSCANRSETKNCNFNPLFTSWFLKFCLILLFFSRNEDLNLFNELSTYSQFAQNPLEMLRKTLTK